ncbi:MAG: hypothetical protein AAF721_18595 [Myxococcota bacterium]
MLGFSSSGGVDFLPDDDARAWVADGLTEVSSHLSRHWGEVATRPRVITDTSIPKPQDLDELFELLCGVQTEIGQGDLEFSLVELAPGDGPSVPRGFEPLGNPEGQLLHTFHKAGEYVVLAVPQIFKVTPLVFSSVARELGRIALHVADRNGTPLRSEPEDEQALADLEADAELAGITLGLGVWVANGAYVYESACCGGGCGIDLTTLRAGLSMPEACFALAVDGQRKGLSRRLFTKHLEPNQTAALKRSWGYVKKQPALSAPPQHAALSTG